MFLSSGPQFALWPRGQRWLLVVLTLLASVAHLARSPQAGGLGLPSGWAAVSAGATRQAETVPDQMAGMDMPGAGPAHAEAGGHAHAATSPAAAPGLSDAAPNAPPHHDHYTDAHCPFCLTAGFALEAQPAIFIFGLAAQVVRAQAARLEPQLAAVRHADARAPPRSARR